MSGTLDSAPLIFEPKINVPPCMTDMTGEPLCYCDRERAGVTLRRGASGWEWSEPITLARGPFPRRTPPE